MSVMSHQRVDFDTTPSQWLWSVSFLLSLSLTGLGLTPFFLVTIFILLNRFFRNKEEFIVELFILCTYSGFISETNFPFKWSDILMLTAIGLLFFYRFPKILRYINFVILAYFVGVLLLALTSNEPMRVQVRMMRYYFVIITYLIPFLLLYKKDLCFLRIGHSIVIYSIVICVFYLIDGFVLSGFVLVPHLPFEGLGADYSWRHIFCYPFSGFFPRKYPQGLYILFLTAFFVARYYRLKAIYWIFIIVALIACRTVTFTVGLVAAYIFSSPRNLLTIRRLIPLTIILAAIFIIDRETGGFFRLSSTVEQFADLKDALETEDLESLAEFGSGRLAQAYPKIESLVESGRLWNGFGFIHPTETNGVNLLLKNTLYSDQSAGTSIELPAEVEVTQIQTILNIGLLGFIFQAIIYIFICWLLYTYGYDWRLFVGVLIAASIAGLGGFMGLNSPDVLWLALALGISLCHQYPEQEHQ